jgi:hypothetical protein
MDYRPVVSRTQKREAAHCKHAANQQCGLLIDLIWILDLRFDFSNSQFIFPNFSKASSMRSGAQACNAVVNAVVIEKKFHN